MSLLRWLRAQLVRCLSISKEEIKVVRREPITITLDEWRKQERLVAGSIILAGNATYRSQIDVLRNSHLAMLATPSNMSAHDLIKHLGRMEGYQICMKNMELMCESSKTRKPLEATFAEPEKEK